MTGEGETAAATALLDEIDQGVVILDRESARYLFINRAGVELARGPARELLGRSFWDVFPDVVGNPVYEAFQRVVTGAGRQRIAPFHYPSWDRWFEAELFPFGSHVGALWRDVTDAVMRRRAEEALRAERDAREQIIGIVAHDLRSPIAAIRMVASAIGAADAPSAAHLTRQIVETAQRLDRRITSLLDFGVSRFGDGIALEPTPVDLARACELAVAELRVVHPDCEVTVTTSGDLGGDWDFDRIVQVFENLLDNAITHGGEAPVRVRAAGEGPSVRVEVHNAGPPIPAELLSQLFEPFRRSPRPRDRRATGLGLYLARQIVVVHGGEIAVRSPDGDGTTFIVTLPRRTLRS
jgi:signal transduction histidine kinase